MKIKLFLTFIFVTLALAAFADDDRPISADKLPAAATTFINKHFAGTTVTAASAENGRRGTTYEVKLSNGAELEFDSEGNWREVDCEPNAVPAAIIPAAIAQYVSSKHPSTSIVKIEHKRHGYKVELSNDIDLSFDENGSPATSTPNRSNRQR